MTDIVPMWHDKRGAGDPVVLLHGGLTDGRCFTGNLDGLAGTFTIYLPDRRGHGRTPDVPGPITIDLMARDTVAFLEGVVGGPARLVGYSAGGTVALYRALPNAELAVLPNPSHLLLMEHAETARTMVRTFLTTDAAPTYMPIARARQGAPNAR
ncbi:Alpha/beta hydrolase family protein [Thermomonospora echinospora]|uniref:Alpha/beta hydrolase family protein n=1 Tax=Thermomonospora echinospora TaxID=1992 RepID=A0A1H5W604_9ACTN|nr:alpha/beta fold hydrolase [Thermomonospora echinospora]SEF94850.1 Alpha/beta hydrolase family protein [Thermomonospora echinospora]